MDLLLRFLGLHLHTPSHLVSPADILTSDNCVQCEARGELGGQEEKFVGDFRWSNELSRATLVLDGDYNFRVLCYSLLTT